MPPRTPKPKASIPRPAPWSSRWSPATIKGKPSLHGSGIVAGIRHVVIGLRDPNPKAAGGMERLAEAGVEVEAGVCEELCRDLVADFLIWQTTKRPYVMLKLAMTLDGSHRHPHRAFPLDHRRNGPPSGA
ncbi:MAG: hypothetical protein ACLSHC_13095 [Bilophila wadsworthia]